MSLFLPKYRAADGTLKRSKVYWMEFSFQGQLIRESTGTRSVTLANRIQDKRRRDLEEGAAGIRKRPRARLFSVAAAEYLEIKRVTLAPSSLTIEKTNLKHLNPRFGRLLVCDIEASDITDYQQKRLEEGAAPGTVNLEIGTLRAVLKKQGIWARLQPEVKMLPKNDDIGRAITAEEERALLQACSESRSRSLLPFVTLAVETGARFGVLRTLQWSSIDLANSCVRFGKDKTASGTGRVVPLNPRATVILKFWAGQFPQRRPEHFVFPREKYGGGGRKDHFGFNGATTYETEPGQPIGDIKEAWKRAKGKAGQILQPQLNKAEPLDCRFHDLRHTAVSRMLDAGVPLMKVAKIVGWSPSTMVQMAARYGHFSLDDLRTAVETITRDSSHVRKHGAQQSGPRALGCGARTARSGTAGSRDIRFDQPSDAGTHQVQRAGSDRSEKTSRCRNS